MQKIRNCGIIAVLLAALLMLVAPAMAEPTPFAISGNVSKANGMACDYPSVLITNTATGEDWNAETHSASNYYRLVITSDNVSAGDVLRIDASGCSQSTTMSETVSQADIDDGGLFGFNITLGPTITSRNDAGDEMNEFYPGENVSVTGTGLAPNTGYTIWIQDDPVGEGNSLPTSVDPSGSQETVQTDANGNFGPELIWSSIPAGSQKNYDIVVDDQDNVYNAASDGIDSATGVGIVAPVPELASIALFAVGLVMLLGWVRFGRGD